MFYTLNNAQVDILLQKIDVKITTSRKTAINFIQSTELVILDTLLINILVILCFSTNALINEKNLLGNNYLILMYYYNLLLKKN